jgi:hypothetical protein
MHRFADLALVAVCGGRVNVAVPGAERGRDRAARLLRRCLEDAETALTRTGQSSWASEDERSW